MPDLEKLYQEQLRLANANPNVCFVCGGPVNECDCGGEGSETPERSPEQTARESFELRRHRRPDA